METSVERTINPFALPRRNSESDFMPEDHAYYINTKYLCVYVFLYLCVNYVIVNFFTD